MAALAHARKDIDRQREIDRKRPTQWQVYWARMAAVDDAAAALADEEIGAKYALRQSLIDLASVCEEMAATLPPPTRP